jgi:hypothetical protein
MKVFFSISLLLFWLKGSIEADGHFIKVAARNTILFGLIPAGSNSFSIPQKNVSSVELHTAYKIGSFVLGFIFFLVGISTIGSSFFWGAFFLVFGIHVFFSGIITVLSISANNGNRTISVPFYEKQKMVIMQQEIEKALIRDTDKTDLGLYFDKKPEKPVEETNPTA